MEKLVHSPSIEWTTLTPRWLKGLINIFNSKREWTFVSFRHCHSATTAMKSCSILAPLILLLITTCTVNAYTTPGAPQVEYVPQDGDHSLRQFTHPDLHYYIPYNPPDRQGLTIGFRSNGYVTALLLLTAGDVGQMHTISLFGPAPDYTLLASGRVGPVGPKPVLLAYTLPAAIAVTDTDQYTLTVEAGGNIWADSTELAVEYSVDQYVYAPAQTTDRPNGVRVFGGSSTSGCPLAASGVTIYVDVVFRTQL